MSPLLSGCLLTAGVVATLFAASALGRRFTRGDADPGSSTLEGMSSGLLGLLLAFNFSVAQSRFEARQELLVREADAIGTVYLRCSILGADDRSTCRALLRRYAGVRVAAYDLLGDPNQAAARTAQLTEGEQIQGQLWALVARAVRDNPDAARALLMSELNSLIDLDADRRAAVRITVPPAVNVAIVLVCIAWAAQLGYAAGARRARSRPAWVLAALVIGVVFAVGLDLDRPRSGFVTTAAAERSFTNLIKSMAQPPVD